MNEPRERDIQKAIIDWLAAERIPVFRMNSGDRFGSYKGKSWRIRGHEPGTADLLCAPEADVRDELGLLGYRHFLWIECKRPGGKQSEAQKSFQQYVESLGMRYLLADSVDAVEQFIRSLQGPANGPTLGSNIGDNSSRKG